MKKSRIICNIITVIYIILSVALCLILFKSNVETESSINASLKIAHIGIFCTCTLLYIWVRNKLAKKMNNKSLSIKISKVYYYLYLAVIVLVSRFIMAYILKDNAVEVLNPGFNIGLGSYLNYVMGLLVKNQMYANVIVNTIITFIACVIIKKIALNITQNDMVATTISIIYILIPQSLAFVTEYIRTGYNSLIILIGIYLLLYIIEQVKTFNKKTNKYLIYAVVFGFLQSFDVILGGSYVLWFVTMVIITSVATYIDIVHIKLNFKNKLNYKLKRLAEKIEKINISKLVYVAGISLGISGIITLISSVISKANNFQTLDVQNSLNILIHSRNYYLVFIISALIFEIISFITNRKVDIKMYIIKIMFVTYSCLTFFMVDSIYGAAVLDILLILNTVMNICNICYNGEERIKLLKEKN